MDSGIIAELDDNYDELLHVNEDTTDPESMDEDTDHVLVYEEIQFYSESNSKEITVLDAYHIFEERYSGLVTEELIGLDDLFALNFYTASNPEDIFGNAYHTAFVTQSDLIMLHRDKIYHSTRHQYVPARDHRCVNYHTKYIFQVPSATHDRGL
ncbi:unnamed protein product [Adineta ricciae]|uniref:Uncharacterized protein n=1 Tax=Adineta ricciae TaxID=249248 RepID=A0A815L8Y4_ADIRI|nr:unnamed protein product [Adineta ricciae]